MRYSRPQVLRRLFAEDGDGAFRPGAFEDFRDETLSQPLTNALAPEHPERFFVFLLFDPILICDADGTANQAEV